MWQWTQFWLHLYFCNRDRPAGRRAAPFLGVWYVLGMSIPAVLGAPFGSRLLRW
ncbi:MAG: NrsF family protein [Burkholderiales bacterium]